MLKSRKITGLLDFRPEISFLKTYSSFLPPNSLKLLRSLDDNPRSFDPGS